MTGEQGKPFAHAERFVLEGDEGDNETWVVLAILDDGGKDYALLAPESELGNPEGDMDVAVFEYHRADDGDRTLGDVPDEATYERVYERFAELMGLEPSSED